MSRVRELLVASESFLARFSGEPEAMDDETLMSAIEATAGFGAAYVAACEADQVDCAADIIDAIDRTSERFAAVAIARAAASGDQSETQMEKTHAE